MSRWVSVASRRKNKRSVERALLTPDRFAGVLSGMIVVVVSAVLSAQPKTLRAGAETQVAPKPHASEPRGQTAFVVETERTLKGLREKLAALGVEALAHLDLGDGADGDGASLTLMVQSAEVGYRHARLAREATELALKEYEEGILKQQEASTEEELRLAKVELEKAQGGIRPAKERLARIMQTRRGTTDDLVIQWRFEGEVEAARLRVREAEFAIEQAQSKRKVLLEFKKPARIKELRADVEKAHSDELSQRATLQLSKSKLIALERAQDPKKNPLIARLTPVLAPLERAIPIEEQLSVRLEKHKQADQPSDALRKEIAGLTRQLEEIVDQAQSEHAATALARLTSRLYRALRR